MENENKKLKYIELTMDENIKGVRNKRLKKILCRVLSIFDDGYLSMFHHEILFRDVYAGGFIYRDDLDYKSLLLLNESLKNRSEKLIAHIIFHELGHFEKDHYDVCPSQDLFPPGYYRNKDADIIDNKKLKKESERYADKFAKKWIKKYLILFPKQVPK